MCLVAIEGCKRSIVRKAWTVQGHAMRLLLRYGATAAAPGPVRSCTAGDVLLRIHSPTCRTLLARFLS